MPSYSSVAGQELHYARLTTLFQRLIKEDERELFRKRWHKKNIMDHRGQRIHHNILAHPPYMELFLQIYHVLYRNDNHFCVKLQQFHERYRRRFHLKGFGVPRGTRFCNPLQIISRINTNTKQSQALFRVK